MTSLIERRELMRIAAENRLKAQLINEGQEVPDSTKRCISKVRKLKKRPRKLFSEMSGTEIMNCFIEYVNIRDFETLEEMLTTIPERINLVTMLEHVKLDNKELINVLMKNTQFKERLLLHIIKTDDVKLFSQFIYSGTIGLMTIRLINYIADNGKNNIMEYLIKYNYHIDNFAYRGYRAAIKNCNLNQLTYLLNRKANPFLDIVDNDYILLDSIPNILLYYAIYYKSNKQIIQFIHSNITDIHCCKEYPIRLAVSLGYGYINMVKMLIDMGANYREVGSVLFISAIQKMDGEMINYLLTKLPFEERYTYNDELITLLSSLEYYELVEKFFN